MRKAPLTLGVLSIVFGAFVGAYSLFGLALSHLGSSTTGDFGARSATADFID